MAYCNAAEESEYIREIYMPANMRAWIQKLPYKLREKWQTRANKLLEHKQYWGGFLDIVVFIKWQVRIAADPILEDLQDSNYEKKYNWGRE